MISRSAAVASSVRSQVSDAEWEARVELAAFYRLVAEFGMTDLIYNHITARSPGEDGLFLINAYGLDYTEVTASSLYKIDLDGNVVFDPQNGYGLNKAGFVIHSAIHGAREDVACVVHTHTRDSVAVSNMKCGLLPLSQSALRFYDRVGYHDFEGPATDLDERGRLVSDLGDRDALFLRNHGLLVCGPTIHSTFHLLQRLETACRIQVATMSAGVELVYPTEEVCQRSVRLMSPTSTDNAIPAGGLVEWRALIRKLDRKDDSYKL